MRQERVAVGECELEVHRYGAGGPIVVLPGEQGVLMGEEFLESLGEFHEVHVPFHPAWAGSTRPSFVRTVRDIALIQQEYLECFAGPVPVVGLSFGGWVAAEIAVTAPSLVEALVLVSPLGIKVGGREDRDFADLYLHDHDDRVALYYGAGGVPVLKERPDCDVYLELARAEEALARFTWSPYLHDPGLVHRLRRVTAPALIVAGDDNGLVLNPDYFQGFAAALGSGASLQYVAGAGHRVEEECPAVLADLVLKFVASSVPG